MIDINENEMINVLVRKGRFNLKGGHCYFRYQNEQVNLVFFGYIYVFDDHTADIGMTYNVDTGFKPHLKIFADYFNKHFCYEGDIKAYDYSQLSYSRAVDFGDMPMGALVFSAKLDTSKADSRSFMNALVLASKELKHFYDTHVVPSPSGHASASEQVRKSYAPKFLRGAPTSKQKPVAYSRKLRR